MKLKVALQRTEWPRYIPYLITTTTTRYVVTYLATPSVIKLYVNNQMNWDCSW